MTLKVPAPAAASEPVMQPAARLAVGDRIAPDFLPSRAAAEVVVVYPFTSQGRDWVLTAHREVDGDGVNVDYFFADAKIPLAAVADFTGLTYTRADSEPDDPTPVSPARVPPHTGSVVDGDELVVDGDEPKCTPACDAQMADPSKATGLARSFHSDDCPVSVHHFLDGYETGCGQQISDLPPAHGYGLDWDAVDCRDCRSKALAR